MWTAVVLAVLGFAMLVAGFTMDRLEVRHIHPASIPGLLPMALGGLLLLYATFLYRGARTKAGDEVIAWGNTRQLFGTGFLCVLYAIGLVGRLPFFVATFLFIATFVTLFTWQGDASVARNLRRVLIAVLTGVIASAVISILFQYGFLVRLP